MGQINSGVIGVQSGTGFSLADSGDLIRTCEIEAVLAAGVITVTAVPARSTGLMPGQGQGECRHRG